MVFHLLLKDLRRARRNPVPYLVHLAIPLLITTLLGMVFAGGGGGRSPLGRIELALVVEDDSAAMRFLVRALEHGGGGEHLQLTVTNRAAAFQRVTNDALAAAVVVPAGFTRDYLSGRSPAPLELLKNPARSLHPAVVEEMLGLFTAGLDALARLLGPDLARWSDVLAGTRELSLREMGDLLATTGGRLDTFSSHFRPLRVVYERAPPPSASTAGDTPSVPAVSEQARIFAFLLPGLSAMFLLFMAETAMRDFQREIRLRTCERIGTYPVPLSRFVISKVLFVLTLLALTALILLGIGPVVFGFRWTQPLAVAALTVGYALFAGGLMATLAGIAGGDRRAEIVTNLAAMLLALASGCAFPSAQLPPFLRENILPWMPPAWFIEAIRRLQEGQEALMVWVTPTLRLALAGVLLSAIATILLQRRVARGQLR